MMVWVVGMLTDQYDSIEAAVRAGVNLSGAVLYVGNRRITV